MEHLSDGDLAMLGGLSGPGQVLPGDGYRLLRSQPGRLEALLADPSVFEAVFVIPGPRDSLLTVSPFLIFALAVHKCSLELADATHVREWLGPHQRIPVFDTAEIRRFLDNPWMRFYLAQLLASFTHVASGSVLVRSRRGWRRQRFSELDPVRMAALLEVVPSIERPGLYRRLGDLALFLTGVFPDHTAASPFGPVQEARLLRTAKAAAPMPASPALPASVSFTGTVGLLEQLGMRWYRIACSSAPQPLTANLIMVSQVAEGFAHARRVLNLVTERYLLPLRRQWFGLEGGAP
jgi:hypothetical protein